MVYGHIEHIMFCFVVFSKYELIATEHTDYVPRFTNTHAMQV